MSSVQTQKRESHNIKLVIKGNRTQILYVSYDSHVCLYLGMYVTIFRERIAEYADFHCQFQFTMSCDGPFIPVYCACFFFFF